MFCCIFLVVCFISCNSHKLYLLVVFLEVVCFHATSYIFLIGSNQKTYKNIVFQANTTSSCMTQDTTSSCMKCCIFILYSFPYNYYSLHTTIFLVSLVIQLFIQLSMQLSNKLYVKLYIIRIQLY